MTKRETLLEEITASCNSGSLIKISLGNKREKAAELKNVFIKPVLIKKILMLSFVYRYPANDITKNFLLPDAVNTINQLLEREFLSADVFTATLTFYYAVDRAGKERIAEKVVNVSPRVPQHDKEKNRLVDQHAPYLHALGITGAEGNVKKEMQHKFRQVNRYVEIIDGIIKNEAIPADFKVIDMGSGKGYLTFALYDHLIKQFPALDVSGVELRKELVDKCNGIARQCGYGQLFFTEGNISDADIENAGMLIALHACDTATDDAIAKGIKASAKIIICAPCCHKQIRKQIAPDNALKNITKHGILLERQAEMVTDTIRALLLEAHGYKTKVFDFIDEEATPKNVLIVGVKGIVSSDAATENLEKVHALKELFGIKEHYLETLL